MTCSPYPVSETVTVRKPETYTEDGANSSSFDGRPDQPLDDSVSLWRDGVSATSRMALDGGKPTAETGLASAQVEEQSRTKGGIRTGGSLPDGDECTNVMRTVRTTEMVSRSHKRKDTGVIADHR